MSRATIWSVHLFTVFLFVAAIVFFLIRDGSPREAGASMDSLMNEAGKATTQDHKLDRRQHLRAPPARVGRG